MLVSSLVLIVLAFLPVASSTWCGLNGLLQALNASGLDQFANITTSLDGTPIGQVILAQLARGNNTIFAPTDNALSSVDPAIINNTTSLADVISYHIVPGNFINQTQTFPNVTIGRTLLNQPDLVALEGNQSQVLIWSKSNNGSLFVINQGSNITVVNSTSSNDTAILAIDSVLTPPPNVSAVLNNASYGLSAVEAILDATTLPNGSSVLDALDSARGITMFAPNNAAVQAAQSSLSDLCKNQTALLNVLFNHVVNGTAVYSTEISNGTTLTSASGQNLAFVVNSTGYFVSVGGSNEVQIVKRNVLTSDGVIHIVDGVMLDTNSNTMAASSALASATSVAAHTTETGVVTAPTQPIPTQPTGSDAGPVRGGANNWKKLVVLAGVVLGLGQFA